MPTAFITIMASGGQVLAQPVLAPNWKPTIFPQIELDKVVVAKITTVTQPDDGPPSQLSLIVPTWSAETRTRTADQCVLTPETRQRTIKNGYGKDEVVDFTVQVPVMTQVERTYTVQVPGAARRVDLPLSNIRVWKIDGTLLSEDQLKSAFANPRHVFLLDLGAPQFQADVYYQSVLSPTASAYSMPIR